MTFGTVTATAAGEVVGPFNAVELGVTVTSVLLSVWLSIRSVLWLISRVQSVADISDESSRRTISDLKDRVNEQGAELRRLRDAEGEWIVERAKLEAKLATMETEWNAERIRFHSELAALTKLVEELETRLERAERRGNPP